MSEKNITTKANIKSKKVATSERVEVQLKKSQSGIYTVHLKNGYVVFKNNKANVSKATEEVLKELGVI